MADDNYEKLADDVASEVMERLSPIIEDFQNRLSRVADLVTDNN